MSPQLFSVLESLKTLHESLFQLSWFVTTDFQNRRDQGICLIVTTTTDGLTEGQRWCQSIGERWEGYPVTVRVNPGF